MACSMLTKLLVLVILAFILCLPEFFTLSRVSIVDVHCMPYDPCEERGRTEEKERGRTGETECKSPLVLGAGVILVQEPVCTNEEGPIGSNVSAFRFGSGRRERAGEPGAHWFVCEANAGLHGNASLLDLSMTVLVRLQVGDIDSLNNSYIHLHPLSEEGEEVTDEDRRPVFCCLTASTNDSLCLLHLTNQTGLKTAAKESSKGEWRCMYRVVWLILLCAVLLVVLSTVLCQVYRNTTCCQEKQPKLSPQSVFHNKGRSHDSAMHAAMQRARPMGLSPINEDDDITDVQETLLDGDLDRPTLDFSGAHLHHRCHLSSPLSSLIPEEA